MAALCRARMLTVRRMVDLPACRCHLPAPHEHPAAATAISWLHSPSPPPADAVVHSLVELHAVPVLHVVSACRSNALVAQPKQLGPGVLVRRGRLRCDPWPRTGPQAAAAAPFTAAAAAAAAARVATGKAPRGAARGGARPFNEQQLWQYAHVPVPGQQPDSGMWPGGAVRQRHVVTGIVPQGGAWAAAAGVGKEQGAAGSLSLSGAARGAGGGGWGGGGAGGGGGGGGRQLARPLGAAVQQGIRQYAGESHGWWTTADQKERAWNTIS